MKKITFPVIAQLVLLAGLMSPSVVSGVAAEELAMKTANGISYVSGGFGIDERETLRTLSQDDNVELSFALQDKEYIGGANVLIRDDTGAAVLKTISDGPLFFAKLPPGKYTVEATAMGKTLKQVAHVESKGQTKLYFAWQESNQEGQA